MPLFPGFRRRWWTGAIACAIGAGCGSHAQPLSAASVELDRIVAIVNDDIIANSELEARLIRVREELRRSGTTPPPAGVLRRQVLERMILTRLQLQLARDSGIRVDDERLNNTLLRIAEQNGLSLREFRNALQRDGYDFPAFREEIREEIMISEVRRRRVESQVHITQRDIDDHLSTMESQGAEADRHRFRLGHILIAVPDGASPEVIAEARERAERMLTDLRGGADFASMAVTHSDGQQALEGGDLGWRQASELPTVFGDAVLRLDVGEITEPIRSASGFHLVKLVDKRGSERQIVEQTRARHILIAPDELTDQDTARRRIETLRTRIVNGEDFGELARVHSDDAGTAPKGGDLGWVDPGTTVPAFDREMESLEPGGLSQPFRSRFGWHIVQVLERRERDDTEAARRAEATRRLRARKIEENMQAWVRQVRAEAYVEYRLEE